MYACMCALLICPYSRDVIVTCNNINRSVVRSNRFAQNIIL